MNKEPVSREVVVPELDIKRYAYLNGISYDCKCGEYLGTRVGYPKYCCECGAKLDWSKIK